MTFSEERVWHLDLQRGGGYAMVRKVQQQSHACAPAGKRRKNPPPPHEGGAAAGTRRGDQAPAPPGAQNTTPAATEPLQEQREDTTLTPIPSQSSAPVYFQDLQTDKLNEFHSSEVQRQHFSMVYDASNSSLMLFTPATIIIMN